MTKLNKIKAIILLSVVCVLAFAVCACNNNNVQKPTLSGSNSTTESVSVNDNSLMPLPSISTPDTSLTPLPSQSTQHIHNHEQVSVKTEPDCTNTGLREKTCACGDVKTEVIPAKGHTWNAGDITQNPTCEGAGTKTFACTVAGCTGTKTETIPATGHVWDAGVVKSEPNCSTGVAGEKLFTCTVAGCTATKTQPIAANHTYGPDNLCTSCGAEKKGYTLNFSDVNAQTISGASAVVIDEVFSIIAGDKSLVIEETMAGDPAVATPKVAEDGTSFTKRMKTGGASDLSKKRRLIEMKFDGAGTLSVYAVSGNTTDTSRTVILYGVLGQIAATPGLDTTIVKKYEMSVPKAGTYYIGSNAGVSIFQIGFEPSAGGAAVVVAPFTFSATEVEIPASGTLGTDLVVNDKITLKAGYDPAYKIAATSKTSTDSKTFTQRISFNTTGDLGKGKAVMQVSVPAAGTLTIYIVSSSKTEARSLVVTDGASFSETLSAPKDYDPVNVATSGPELVSPQVVTLAAAGDYYLYSTGGGIYFYELNYVPAE